MNEYSEIEKKIIHELISEIRYFNDNMTKCKNILTIITDTQFKPNFLILYDDIINITKLNDSQLCNNFIKFRLIFNKLKVLKKKHHTENINNPLFRVLKILSNSVDFFDYQYIDSKIYIIKNDMVNIALKLGMFELDDINEIIFFCLNFENYPRTSILTTAIKYNNFDIFKNYIFGNSILSTGLQFSYYNECANLIIIQFNKMKSFLNNKFCKFPSSNQHYVMRPKIRKLENYIASVNQISTNNTDQEIDMCNIIKKIVNDKMIQRMFDVSKNVIDQINISIFNGS